MDTQILKKNVVKILLDSMFEINEMLLGTIDVKSRITHFHISYSAGGINISSYQPTGTESK